MPSSLDNNLQKVETLFDRMSPVPKNSGFRMDGYFIWGGSVIKAGPKYNMFASRWPEETGFPGGYMTLGDRASGGGFSGGTIYIQGSSDPRSRRRILGWRNGPQPNYSQYQSGVCSILQRLCRGQKYPKGRIRSRKIHHRPLETH